MDLLPKAFQGPREQCSHAGTPVRGAPAAWSRPCQLRVLLLPVLLRRNARQEWPNSLKLPVRVRPLLPPPQTQTLALRRAPRAAHDAARRTRRAATRFPDPNPAEHQSAWKAWT